jgi:hypothetical protein
MQCALADKAGSYLIAALYRGDARCSISIRSTKVRSRIVCLAPQRDAIDDETFLTGLDD